MSGDSLPLPLPLSGFATDSCEINVEFLGRVDFHHEWLAVIREHAATIVVKHRTLPQSGRDGS